MNFVNLSIWFLNKFFFGPNYDLFLRQLKEPALTQEKLLKILIKDLSKTEYGKQYKISANDSYKEFSSKLPVIIYEDLKCFIAKMKDQNLPNILITEKPIYWETTSGSSNHKKLIPYNYNLLNSFENTFKIWVSGLLSTGQIKLQKAKIFFSISPTCDMPNQQPNQANFKSDFEYLGRFLGWIFKFFVLNIPKTNNLNSFHKELSLCLLREENLEIISIWSPSYLLAILNYIQENFLVLLSEISKKT